MTIVDTWLKQIKKQLVYSGHSQKYDWEMYQLAFSALLQDVKRAYKGTQHKKILNWKREDLLAFLNSGSNTTLLSQYKLLVANLYYDSQENAPVNTRLGPITFYCDYCSSTASFKKFDTLNRRHGSYGYICDGGCDASVGFHEGDKMPLGSLANSDLRLYRQKNFVLLLQYEKRAKLGRKAAYKNIATAMGLEYYQAKITRLSLQDSAKFEQCIFQLLRRL